MNKHGRKLKCHCCQQWFLPNPKAAFRQKYCSRPRCKRVSKAASQKKWKDKPGNRKLADPAKEQERVRRWRAGKSKHWRRVFSRFHRHKVVLRRDDRLAGQ
jgi:hypothetical protein